MTKKYAHINTAGVLIRAGCIIATKTGMNETGNLKMSIYFFIFACMITEIFKRNSVEAMKGIRFLL